MQTNTDIDEILSSPAAPRSALPAPGSMIPAPRSALTPDLRPPTSEFLASLNGTPESWAATISQSFAAALSVFNDGVKRAIACGALLIAVKETGKERGIIKHGEFGPWLEKHCPEIPKRTSRYWMEIAHGTICQMCIGAEDLLEIVSTPPGELQGFRVPQLAEFNAMVEGKSSRQLMIEWKSDRAKGGDNIWQMWINDAHPELLTDGTVPPRNHTPKAIREEFTAWQLSQVDPAKDAEKQRELARIEVQALIDRLRQLRADDNPAAGLVPTTMLIVLRNEMIDCGKFVVSLNTKS